MVAHDEVGGLLPIKRTIRVLDVNNQSFREQEVSPKEAFGHFAGFPRRINRVILNVTSGLRVKMEGLDFCAGLSGSGSVVQV